MYEKYKLTLQVDLNGTGSFLRHLKWSVGSELSGTQNVCMPLEFHHSILC
jgi:hypothetical protein